MGLYDDPQGMLDPKTAGLLAAGFGMLQASGPSRMPVPFGAVMGQGGMQGLGAYQSAANSARQFQQQQALIDLEKQKTALTAAQTHALLQKDAMQNLFNQHVSNLFSPVNPGQAAMTAGASQGDVGPTMTNADRMKTIPPSNGFSGMTPQQLFQLSTIGGINGINTNPMIEGWKVANPELKFEQGVPLDPRTGQPRAGAPILPHVNQQGYASTLGFDPTNKQFSIGPTPGAESTYARQQDIGERAKANYDLVTIPASSAGQNPRMVPRAQLVDQAPGQLGIAAGMSPAATGEQAAAAEQQKDVAKNYAGIYNNLQNAAMANPAKIANTQRIGDLLQDFEGGKFSTTAMGLAQAFNSVGLKVDPKLPNKEAAEALSGQIALELRTTASGNGMPGAMSDADREFLKGMTPNLALTAEGRKQIIESKVKIMERENKVASMAREYRKRFGNLDEDFFSQLSTWSERNRLFK